MMDFNPTKTNVRELQLEVIDNKKPKNSIGLTDARLFQGENKILAVREEDTCLWKLQYEKGGVPAALKEVKFTSFNKLFEHAKKYFETRNVRIKDVVED